MEIQIPTWLFFSFWALTGTTFLHLSFHALHKTHLSDVVSPLFMLFLNHSLAISSFSSSTYALKYRLQLIHQLPTPHSFIFYAILSALLTKTTDAIILRAIFIYFYARLLYFAVKLKSLLIPIPPIISKILLCVTIVRYAWLLRGEILSITCSLIKIGSQALLALAVNLVSAIFSLQTLCYISVFCVGFVCYFFLVVLRFSCHFIFFLFDMVLNSGTGNHNSTAEMRARVAVLMVLEISLFFASVRETRFFSPVLVLLISHLIPAFLCRLCEDGMMVEVKESRMRKLAEFAVGIAGAIVFQKKVLSPFASSDDDDVAAAWMYLGVMWLANLTLLGFPIDLGVFYFVVGNAAVAGWRCCSWMPCAAALLLLALRLKLESLTLVYEEDAHIQVAIFSHS